GSKRNAPPIANGPTASGPRNASAPSASGGSGASPRSRRRPSRPARGRLAPGPPGSVPPAPAGAIEPKAAAKTSVVEGWSLRKVYGSDAALVEGRYGVVEIMPGDLVPGLGRIQEIKRQDGHWVVVTSRGLIDSSR